MRAVAAVAVCFILGACASSPDVGGGTGDRYVITHEQILESGATNLLGVLRVLRMDWLPHREGSHILLCWEGESSGNILECGEYDTKRLSYASSANPFYAGRNWEEIYSLEWISPGEARALFEGPKTLEPVDVDDVVGGILIRRTPIGGG
jgi:hypothetical protein